MNTNKENGFSLVEILASLTILGIVFISFMTIFPQMNNFNNRTEAKLETMNVAKQELAKLKSTRYPIDINKKIKSSTIKAPYETFLLSDEEYRIEMFCYDENKQNCSGKKNDDNSENKDRKTQLYKIYIEVTKQGKISSETFGYLKLE